MKSERAPLLQRFLEWSVANPLRLVLLLLLYVGVPVLLVGEVSSQITQQGLRRDQFQSAVRVADNAAAALDSSIIGLRDRLNTSIAAGSVAAAVARGQRSELEGLLRERRTLLEHVRRLALLDRAGATIASDPAVGGPPPGAWSEAVTAVSRDRRTYVSEVFAGAEGPAIVIAGAVEPGTANTVFVAELDLQAIGASLGPLLGSVDDAYVIDARGRMVARAASAAPLPLPDLASSAPVRSALQVPMRIEGDDPLGGGRRFMASAAAPGLGWHVIALKSTAPLERAVTEVVDQLALSRIVLVVIVLLGAFAMARNVGQLVRQRRKLAEMNLRLEQASQAKSHFLASVSHELRTPMNAILGFTDALLNGVDGPLNDEQRQSLTWVQRGGRDLLELINDILDLSKIEAGGLVLSPEAFDPAALVETIVGQNRPLAEQRGLRFESHDEGHPRSVVLDRQRTRQILVNLIGNALKFTSAGSVTVVLGGAARGRLEVSIRDTGPGIPADQQENIFEDFRQIETGRPAGVSGTGLGLAICRRLARMMGGDVTVESAPGQGSTFLVVLPTDCRKPEERRPALEPASRGERLVLTIDDDPSFGSLVQKMLADTGWNVASVTDPASAVDEAGRLLPDAITLDLLMPGRDGLQILHDLRDDPATRDIPVIVVTVLDAGASVVGAQAHLAKPMHREALLETLDSVVGGAKAPA